MTDIDWCATWEKQMQENLACEDHTDCAAFWSREDIARAYAFGVQATQKQGAEKTIALLGAKSGHCILDIGAGPGTFAVPLARMGCFVTAVEPAPPMVDRLKKSGGKLLSKRLFVVEKKWEDIDPSKDSLVAYDHVICSFALGMTDICSAISKMEDVCAGQVALIWFYGEPSWNRHSRLLYPMLHNRAHVPMPDARILEKALKQLGVSFQSRCLPYRGATFFKQPDHIAEFYSPRYNAKTKEQKKVLEDYFGRLAKKTPCGFRISISSDARLITWKAGARVKS